jgi:hypothetical protein
MAVLSKIEQRLEKLRQETQKALAAKRQAEQALEQQKRVIVARVVLERCKTDDAFAETIRALLKETVTSDREKAAIADLLIRPVADTAGAPPAATEDRAAGASLTARKFLVSSAPSFPPPRLALEPRDNGRWEKENQAVRPIRDGGHQAGAIVKIGVRILKGQL